MALTHRVWGGARTPHMPTYCGQHVWSDELSNEPTCLECLVGMYDEWRPYFFRYNVHDETV